MNIKRVKFFWGLAAVITFASIPAVEGAPLFQTHFQDEAQFVVETIVADIAEQTFYAAKGRLPESKAFSVNAVQQTASPADVPVYDVEVGLDSSTNRVNFQLKINTSIWSPALYKNAAAALAKAAGLKSPAATVRGETALLKKLFDSKAETIEQENLALSKLLENNFTDPELHEQAALLLGAFTMRDMAHRFDDPRLPLSRMTAHLAMAGFLEGGATGPNGRLAEAILLATIDQEVQALTLLDHLESSDAQVARMARVVRGLCTGDFRPLANLSARAPLENVVWFRLVSDNEASSAWEKLTEEQQRTVDYLRIANNAGPSIEIGHEILEKAVSLELREFQSVSRLTRPGLNSRAAMISALNELPERCFTKAPDNDIHVRVIGWGQWAAFFQRHLCNAVQSNFDFMQRKWGVPDDAREYAAQSDALFDGLRLYPFVRRYNSTDAAAYHKAVDESVKLTTSSPQLLPMDCWVSLTRTVSGGLPYYPGTNDQTIMYLYSWYSHNPLPGSLLDFGGHVQFPTLANRMDFVPRLEMLHEAAPSNMRIIRTLLEKKYNKRPTYEQAFALCKSRLPFSVGASRIVAATVRDQPARYEEIMLKAALFDPACYYDLGNFALNLHQDDKAAQYFDKACDVDPAGVRIAEYADWRLRYWLKKGDKAKAQEIADYAGEVYSTLGLAAKATFLELTGDYDGAFAWFQKIEERYGDSSRLQQFVVRYRATTGSKRFDSVLTNLEKTLFPKGQEKVSVSDLHGPPADGVTFAADSTLLSAANLRRGDIIVAISGIRVHNIAQYSYLRGLLKTPELDLIVWQGSAYRESKSSPPNHLFGVGLANYSQGAK